jgi:HPt (histidine-containing phosphotransfer) domain-containing protein
MNAPANAPLPVPLDRETIERLRNLAQETDPSLFADILHTFCNDVAQYLEAMRQAISQGDVASLKHTAHAVKGASMNTGALSLANISASMEDAALTGNFAIVPGLLVGLEREFQRVAAGIALELSGAA